MHSFEVHSNESACKEKVRLGMEQVIMQIYSNHNSQILAFQDFHQIYLFSFYTSMHGVTGSPSFWYSIRKVWLLIRFFISLRVAFGQGLFMFSDNLVTSEKFLGSGMKWETSEPDSPKVLNSCEIYFTTVLNTLFKPFPVFLVAFNAPLHYKYLCLIRSRIL